MPREHVARQPFPALRFVLLIALSVAVMALDNRSHYLVGVRSVLSVVLYPLQSIAAWPEAIADSGHRWFGERSELAHENQRIKEEQLLLKARLQRMVALKAENLRLRELLGAAEAAADEALVAEILEVSLEPFTQRVLLDKGASDGVREGQPVIDADGVMGQVVRVTPFRSTVILITDPSHAIPVYVKRNHLRGILYGTGSQYVLDLPHMTPMSDVRSGDELVTSGMGGRFPIGYPVANVTTVRADPNEAFLQIQATPLAGLDRSRQVLLVRSRPESGLGDE
ncbi:MAG: rod shape-determining protein MreC [Gammaproteobacteria bacterium]|jgi:rod shape-determining protein MreC|nr:rod shape-determining protein MreC [Gammaproteobacteria bacterium]